MYTVRFAYALAVMACLNGGRFWATFVMTALGLDDPSVHCEQFNDEPEQAECHYAYRRNCEFLGY